jgi:hypothetical protein
MKEDYEIGYGKPPVHTRFVTGKSGNPKGRPRKQFYGHRIHRSHIRDDMERLLPQKIHVSEGGRTKRITRQRAQIRGLVNRAIDGHNPSIHQLWSLIKHFGVDREPNKDVTFWRRNIPFEPGWEKLRPPKRANLMDDLLLELQEPITITERGKQKQITKQEALLRILLVKSTASSSAFQLFWAIFRHYDLDQEPDKYLQPVTQGEHEAWLQRLERIRREVLGESCS